MLLPHRSRPWTIKRYNDTCFVVADADGLGIGYFYYRREALRPSYQDENDARDAAVAFAQLSRATGTSEATEDLTAVQIVFQVIRDGNTVFEKRFPAPIDRRYADITALAISEFQIAHPDVLLVDEDVILKWAEVE